MSLPRTLLFLAVAASPLLGWALAPSTPLALAIVDRTVPDGRYREHRGLVWLLNHWKVTRPDGRAYAADVDYWGAHPQPSPAPARQDPSAALPPAPAAIYVADTYGLYPDTVPPAERRRFAERPAGGLTAPMLAYLEREVARGAVLAAEFNTFASPTEPAVSRRAQALLGVTWTGWAGRYVHDLAQDAGEVGPALQAAWARRAKKPYAFAGPGLLLVHESGRVVVLDRTGLRREGVRLTFAPDEQSALGVPADVAYPYWFDVVKPRREASVWARYAIAATAEGVRSLQEAGIPTTFPAIVRYAPRDAAARFYFCGDFADTEELPGFHQVFGMATLNAWLVPQEPDRAQAFFWKVYAPIMKRFLAEARP